MVVEAETVGEAEAETVEIHLGAKLPHGVDAVGQAVVAVRLVIGAAVSAPIAVDAGEGRVEAEAGGEVEAGVGREGDVVGEVEGDVEVVLTEAVVALAMDARAVGEVDLVEDAGAEAEAGGRRGLEGEAQLQAVGEAAFVAPEILTVAAAVTSARDEAFRDEARLEGNGARRVAEGVVRPVAVSVARCAAGMMGGAMGVVEPVAVVVARVLVGRVARRPRLGLCRRAAEPEESCEE